MDLITKSPGLQHIAELIFLNLDYNKLEECQKVDDFWKKILSGSLFWLKKCVQIGLSEQHHLEWTKLIQQPKNPQTDKVVTSYLMKMYKYHHTVHWLSLSGIKLFRAHLSV